MRALVTGAAGFLGANLVRHLAAAGHEVVALTRSSATAWRLEEIATEVRVLDLDLSDTAAIEQVVATTEPQWVFHLAAHGAYSWQTDLEADDRRERRRHRGAARRRAQRPACRRSSTPAPPRSTA